MIGIYKILNIITAEFYVGSTRASFHTRKLQHFSKLRNNKHDSPILQNAWNKYGANSFIFEVIEVCLEQNLNQKEQFYIDTLNPKYNVCKIVGSRKGIRVRPETLIKMKQRAPYKHTEETKRQLSISHKGLNTWAKNRKLSPEHIQKLKNAAVGRDYSHLIGRPAWNKGIAFNKEVRLKMSLAKKGKTWSNEKKAIFTLKIAKYRPKVIRCDGKIYENVSEASLDVGVKENSIIKFISRNNPNHTLKGFKFSYLKKGQK